MDKRTILGILIILAIFFLSEQFIWKKQPAPIKPNQDTLQSNSVKQDTIIPPILKKDSPVSLFIPSSDSLKTENNLVIENDSLKVVFSNLGAVITKVYLKKFTLANKELVQLIPEGKSIAGLSLSATNGLIDLNKQIYKYEWIKENRKQGIRFILESENNSLVQKTFLFDKDYGIKLNLKIHIPQSLLGYTLNFDSGLNHTEQYLKAKNQDYRFYAQVDNISTKIDLNKLLKNSQEHNGKIDWAAARTKYFVIGCLIKPPILINKVIADTANGSPAFTLFATRRTAAIDWNENFLIYTGPAQYKLLKSHGAGLENVAERGSKWLRWLVDIFAWFLTLLYRLIPNYGIVIIIFSLVLKIVLHPLTHKSMDSSLKMQKIQPQVAALQQQYKNDPKRLQQELSKLYKETGASPLGGCLPLLLQMPVFFALYTVLRYSLDMRQAAFFGWMKDLSEPDPYYILPILMGIFMIVQQLMMAPKKEQLAQMDEKQQAMQQSQKMMTWIMPIILFFVFKSMPAGLVLYWTVFNILSIIQQYYLQKKLIQKESK